MAAARIAATAAIFAASLVIAARADQAGDVRIAATSYAQVQRHVTEPLLVEPFVFAGAYALADWVAGLRQGEVLLARSGGKWHVVAFENNTLADARFLTTRYGVPHATAVELVKAMRAAQHREG